MKIANIDWEILHNFWTTRGISMNFSEKMCLMITLKVTKNQGFTLSLEDSFFEKLQGGEGQFDPLQFFFCDIYWKKKSILVFSCSTSMALYTYQFWNDNDVLNFQWSWSFMVGWASSGTHGLALLLLCLASCLESKGGEKYQKDYY